MNWERKIRRAEERHRVRVLRKMPLLQSQSLTGQETTITKNVPNSSSSLDSPFPPQIMTFSQLIKNVGYTSSVSTKPLRTGCVIIELV